MLAGALRGETRPVILAGDFNTPHLRPRAVARAADGRAGSAVQPGGALRRRLLHPKDPAREPLFDELRGAGFEWAPFVDRSPRSRYASTAWTAAHPLRPRTLPGGTCSPGRRGARSCGWTGSRGAAGSGGRGFTVPDPKAPGALGPRAARGGVQAVGEAGPRGARSATRAFPRGPVRASRGRDCAGSGGTSICRSCGRRYAWH